MILKGLSFLFFIFFLIPSFASRKDGLGIELENLYFYEFKDPETVTSLTLSYKYSYKYSKYLGLLIDPQLDINEFKNSKDNYYLIRTTDSGLFYKKNDFIFSFGLLSHSFGLSQLFSPVNFIDTYSYWNPLDPKPLSNPALRVQYKTESGFRLFASYIPKRQGNIYPGNNSPWVPSRSPEYIKTDSETFLFPEKPAFQFLDSAEYDDALSHNSVFGLRFENKSITTQLIHFQGLDNNPVFDLDLDLNLVDATPGNQVLEIQNPIRLVPIYQKISRTGFSFRYTLPFKWRLLYEGSLSEGNPNVREGYSRNEFHTAGLEWGVPIGKYLLVGVLQFYKSKTTEQNSDLGLNSPFEKAFLIGASMEIQKTTLEMGYLKSQSLGISLITAKLNYSFKNYFVEGSLYTITGDVNEVLASIIDHDLVSIKIGALF